MPLGGHGPNRRPLARICGASLLSRQTHHSSLLTEQLTTDTLRALSLHVIERARLESTLRAAPLPLFTGLPTRRFSPKFAAAHSPEHLKQYAEPRRSGDIKVSPPMPEYAYQRKGTKRIGGIG
ncbi:MAG: hypothetical protein M3227_08150 [Thermoproteota archaeon]|nr:hypothetical protein [Thermoproteota archaeon]